MSETQATHDVQVEVVDNPVEHIHTNRRVYIVGGGGAGRLDRHRDPAAEPVAE